MTLITEAEARHAKARCILKRYLRRNGMQIHLDSTDESLVQYSKLIYRLKNGLYNRSKPDG